MISDQGSPGVIDRDLDPLNSTLFNQNQDKKWFSVAIISLFLLLRTFDSQMQFLSDLSEGRRKRGCSRRKKS